MSLTTLESSLSLPTVEHEPSVSIIGFGYLPTRLAFTLLLLALDDADGMVKIISDQKTDRILGVHIMGPVSQAMMSVDYLHWILTYSDDI